MLQPADGPGYFPNTRPGRRSGPAATPRFGRGAAVLSAQNLLEHRRVTPPLSQHDLGGIDVHYDETCRVSGTHR